MDPIVSKFHAADPKFRTGYTAASGNVTTPLARASYAHVFKPQAPMKDNPNATPKYSLTLLFPLEADLTLLKKMAHEAIVKKWGADETKWPRNGEGVLTLRSPFRDQGEKAAAGYVKGAKFINVSSEQKPQLLDALGRPIDDESMFYSGCWCWVTVNAYAYDKAGNKGVAFGLQNVQKLADDEPLSGRARAESEFAPVAVPGAAAAAGGAASMFE